MTYRADLHCHSTCSDGTLSPRELLHLAKEVELSAISITDHDTLEAYTESVFTEADQLGIRLFVGVEFSARLRDVSVHILGYAVKRTEDILTFCEEHQKRRRMRNRLILEKLSRLSLPITEEELMSGQERASVGRPHIAQLMIEKNYVTTFQQAFDRYIGEGKCCFDSGRPFSVQETLDHIHRSDGKAFVAHPHLIRNSRTVNELCDMDFDGIECYYSLLRNTQERKWLQITKQKGWLISGGSDFHGSVKPQVKLGCSYVGEEEVRSIFGTQ